MNQKKSKLNNEHNRFVGALLIHGLPWSRGFKGINIEYGKDLCDLTWRLIG